MGSICNVNPYYSFIKCPFKNMTVFGVIFLDFNIF